LDVRTPMSRLPEFMRFDRGNRARSPVFLVTNSSNPFDPLNTAHQKRFNDGLTDILFGLDGFQPRSPVLIKVHIGESNSNTRMLPVYTENMIKYLQQNNIDNIFFGDTTVTYSSSRGYRENGPKAQPYLAMAEKHGWTKYAPFVVLDRPETGPMHGFDFYEEEIILSQDASGRFKRFSLSGGFARSDSVIHHAHLTLHGLAHVALCVKGLTMGLSGRTGKHTMHQHYYPSIDEEECSRCLLCVETYPEEALTEDENSVPIRRPDRCIGCGECMAVCPNNAITMEGQEITDWAKGEDSLPYRMVNYLIGMTVNRWEHIVHVAHLYNITLLCDCVNQEQTSICNDIGFLVGRNPFAVDRADRQILEQRLAEQGGKSIAAFHPGDTGYKIFEYAQTTYGVITEPEIEVIKV